MKNVVLQFVFGLNITYKMLNSYTQLFILVSFTVSPIIIQEILKRRIEKKRNKLKTEHTNYYHELVFISMKQFKCRGHIINNTECGDSCGTTQLRRMIKFISSATICISCCVYMFTSEEITEALIEAHRRGIKIRIITDEGLRVHKPSKIDIWIKNGKIVFSLNVFNSLIFKLGFRYYL